MRGSKKRAETREIQPNQAKSSFNFRALFAGGGGEMQKGECRMQNLWNAEFRLRPEAAARQGGVRSAELGAGEEGE